DWGVLAGVTGRSIGKWTTGLRIENMDGGPPGIVRALLRHFIGYPLSLILLGLGFLITIVTPSGRGLHDFISGTVVIRKGVTVAAPARQPRPSHVAAPRATE